MFRSNQSNSEVGTSLNQDCEGRGIMKTRRGEEEREILRLHRSGIIVTLTLELEDSVGLKTKVPKNPLMVRWLILLAFTANGPSWM